MVTFKLGRYLKPGGVSGEAMEKREKWALGTSLKF